MKKIETYSEFQSINESKDFRRLLPKFVLNLAKQFQQNNVSLYVVGGAVRDFMLGKRPKDYDLATDAKPDVVQRIVTKMGYKTIPVGEQFGVVVAVDDSGQEFEIATFREDIGNSGRNPNSVSFTNIETDVKRRDLTVNALFYDIAQDKIVDLVGGKQDLKSGTIKTVGTPQDRFDEDPLRKLRAIRFFARMGKKFDSNTKQALIDNTNLQGVSSERIYQEFKKAISQAKKPSVYVKVLYKFGYLEDFFPNLKLYTRNFIDSKNYLIQAAWILQNNSYSKLKKPLNAATWTNKDIKKISLLIKFVETVGDYSEAYSLIRGFNDLKNKSMIQEWIEYQSNSKTKQWIQKLINFDISQIDMEELLAKTDDPSEMPKMIQKEIEKRI